MDQDQFAQTIKQKYPQYKDWDNAKLTQTILAKYPQYNSMVKMGKPQQPTGTPQGGTPPSGTKSPQQSPLQALMGGVKNVVGTGMKLAGQAQQEKSRLEQIIGKGAITGGKEMAGGITWMVEQNQKQQLINPLRMLFPKEEKALEEGAASKAIYANAAKSETKDTSNLSAGEKFVYGMSKFIPTMLIPEVGPEAKGLSLLGKLGKSGLNNMIQSAALYNPEQAAKDVTSLRDFVNQAASNFVGGVAAHGVGSVLKGVVMKPMKYAVEAVTSKINKNLTDDIFAKLTPSVLGKFSENTVTMDSKELGAILRGQKTSYDSTFFSSPQWKEVVKQYGANIDNYPERITVMKPDPLPVIEGMRVPKLAASDLHDVMSMHFQNAAASLAQGDLEGHAGDMAVMNEVASEMEKRGYKVDRAMLANGVNDYANFQRDYESFHIGVADKEFKKSLLTDLDNKGFLKQLQMVRKTYNLVKGQANYTDQKVADQYLEWGGKEGVGGFDELGEALRNEGYDIPVNDPSALIEFANNLPTGQEVLKKVVAPDAINPHDILQAAIKFPNGSVERPFVVSQAELDKVGKPKENVGNPDVAVNPLENLVNKSKDDTKPSPPPGTLASMVGKAKQTAEDIRQEGRSTFYPAGKGEQSKEAAGILRQYKATSANQKTVEHVQNKKYENAFGKLSPQKQIEYISNYERTGDFGLEAQAFLKKNGIDATKYAQFYKESTDAAHQILQDVFGLEGYVNNYIRHAFTFSDKNEESKFVQGFTKTLQNYSTSPLKQRKFATMQDALDWMSENGIKGKPVETNPETLRQWTINNAKTAQAFSAAKNELKNNFLIRYLKPGAALLPNEDYLNDKWSNVYFKGEGGLTLGGRWVAPKEVATLVNNAVSNGLLEQSPTLKFLQNVNNHLNQFQLGVSAFHVATTTVNSAASELGLGMQELLNTKGFNIGMRAKGLTRIVKASTVIEPLIEDYLRGNAAIKKIEGGNSDATAYLLDRVNKAGGRLNIENRYRTQSIKAFQKSLANKNIFGAGVHFLPAALEKMSYPIMEQLVPRVKLGRFLTEGDSAIARATSNYTKDISTDQTRRILGEVWDKIDNIHGQLVQDNLFWNNKAKDMANMFFRSFGWSYGTLRALGNAGKDTAGILPRLKKGGDLLTPSMGIAIAYPLITAEIGAMIHYFNTGQSPQSYKDYFFPQSGSTKPDGTPIRLSVPGYMKDLFSYWRNPLQTLLNKTSPELQAAQEIFQNRDYYGVMLRNPQDPVGTQFEQMGSYAFSKLIPFSLQSIANIQSSKAGNSQMSPQEVMESIFGFQKAGAVIDNSDTQNAIQQAYNNQSGQKTLTPEEKKIQDEKSAAKTAARAGDFSKIRALVKQGVYTSRGSSTLLTQIRKQKAQGTTGSEALFKLLAPDQQVAIFNQMTPQEKLQYEKYLNRQAKAALAGRQ